jgi:hypothetical protein
VHPLLIALVFVVMMASPAVVALQYAAKPKRELALEHGAARQRLPRRIESSVILLDRVPASVRAAGPRLLASLKPIEQPPMNNMEREE